MSNYNNRDNSRSRNGNSNRDDSYGENRYSKNRSNQDSNQNWGSSSSGGDWGNWSNGNSNTNGNSNGNSRFNDRNMSNGRNGNFKKGGNQEQSTSSVIPSPIDVIKDFYIKTKDNQRGREELETFYQNEQVTVVGENVPQPMLSFADYLWPAKIQNAFRLNGYAKPTPIQSQGWPIALSGKDMVGIAQTGSGKTLAYILPAFIHIDGQPGKRKDDGPMALVLAPTRELAQQIQDVVRQCGNYCRSVCIFGGAPKYGQLKDIQRTRPQIVIATPGRLIDFLNADKITMANVSYLVLDEADRMLDMGFEPQIRNIINRIPANRQTLMWSATWPKEVRTLASDFLVDYIQINVGSLNLHANHNITQIVDICSEHEKKEKLFRLMQEILRETKENKTIIFAETKRKVDEIAQLLRGDGWPANCIHGDKSQQDRDWTLKEFKNGRSPILVATDVAARGLDVEDIKFVINFDYPNCSEDYVHRIGRTGRRNNKGTAYTFFTKENGRQATDLIGVLREANQVINPQLYSIADMSKGGGRDKYRRWGYVPRDGQNRNQMNNKRKSDFDNGPNNKRFHSDNGKDNRFKNEPKRDYSYPAPNAYSSRFPPTTSQSRSYPPQAAPSYPPDSSSFSRR